MSHLEPHHLVVVAPVGKDHLGAVLAQPVADATAHKAVGPEDGHNVAAERGPTATAAFHRRQVDRAVSGLQLEKNLLPVKKNTTLTLVSDADPDLWIRICIIKFRSGSVWRDTNPDPDPGHIRKMCRNKQWQLIKINPLFRTFLLLLSK